MKVRIAWNLNDGRIVNTSAEMYSFHHVKLRSPPKKDCNQLNANAAVD